MNKTALLISLLALLLFALVPASLADTCARPTNICDDGYAARAGNVTLQLQALYASQGPYLTGDTGSVPLRYPAAFFYLSQGQGGADLANQLIATQLNLSVPSPIDALYLAWSYAEFKAELSAQNMRAIEGNLSLPAYGAPLTAEEGDFLTKTAHYLLSPTAQQESALSQLLRAKGDVGWDAEANPAALADVVVGLAALRNESSDATLRLLAEMNLDLIFSRFAALDSAGAFAGPFSGATIASGLYDPAASPWYGWSYLLFATDTPLPTEPGLAYSGYCANAATQAVYDARATYALEVREPLGGGYSDSIAYSDFTLGGADDVGSNFSGGYAVRASVRFADDPRSFILFTTATSNSSAANGPDASDDGGRVFTDASRSLILGQLGGGPCREPHLFLGSGFEWSAGASGVTIIHQLASDEYFALRFDGGQANATLGERYAPLAGMVPALYDGDRGTVIFPLDAAKGGVFAFERIPSPPADMLGDLGAIEEWAAANSSLTVSDGRITYSTNLSSPAATYAYVPGESLLLNKNVWSADGFSVRRVKLATSEESIVSRLANGNWSVYGNGYIMTLNFSQPGKSAPGAYGCAAALPPSVATGQLTTDEERLAFLAASLLKGRSGAYTLACGDPADVLPLSAGQSGQLDAAVKKACVLSYGNDRTVGIIYSTEGDGLPGVIQNTKLFFPFTENGVTGISSTICAAVADTTPSTLDFAECGQASLGGKSRYDPLHLFLSPNADALIISSDANPAAAGVFAAIRDFLRGLFGGGVSLPAADPSSIAPFEKAYAFSDGNGKEIHALVTPQGETDALYLNFAGSVAPLIKGVSGATYLAGGQDHHAQFINVSGDALWPRLTSQLRVASGGTPADFGYDCGDGKIQYGEQCDKGADGAVVGPCPGNPNFNVTCSHCQLNSTQCSVCVDADEDGYYASGCPLVPSSEWDCDDTNPLVHPRAVEKCANGIDDNCNGCVDSQSDGCAGGPACGGGPQASPFTCAAGSACQYVCNVTLAPPGPGATTCPTDWVDAGQQGDYSFSVRINATGFPELKITPSNRVIGGVRCNWDAESMTSAAPRTFFWSPGDDSALFFNGGASSAKVTLSQVGELWTIGYVDGGSGASRTCWNTTGTRNPLVTITPFSHAQCDIHECTPSPDSCTVPATCDALDSGTIEHCVSTAGWTSGGGGGGGGGGIRYLDVRLN